MTERIITDVLADARRIAAGYDTALENSPWLPREMAAQIAERIACVNVPQDRSAEFLDGWVAACEAIAATIRECANVRHVR